MALCWLTTLCAQEFGSHWIRIPQPDSLSHVWFRQTYVEDGLPLEARVTVASPGYYKLYVNECNVGTALFYPPRLQADSQPVAMTFDVTPFLRADTNVVALCYAPSYPHVDSSQVSVQFFGVDASGAPFSRFSDGGWLCRRANSRWTVDGKEHVDGRLHDASWKAAWFNPALWLTADERKAAEGAKVTYLSATHPVLRHVHTDGYCYFDRDGCGVSYEFGVGFHGMVRLTLREARRGERISYDGLEYVCNGQLDEQAYPVFRMADYRRVRVTGGRRFKRDQITVVEAIQTAYEPDGDGLPW